MLHSRKLVLCLLAKAEQHVTYTPLCEHSLDRNAYNMVQGSFGGPGRCILCVQSVDGALFFFEGDKQLFQIQLPDFLIPGPLIFAQAIDSVVLANTNLELECYRYTSLQASTNNNIAQQKAA